MTGCGSGRGPMLQLKTVNKDEDFQSGQLLTYTSYKQLMS
jgi:hypothetical protein